ncbi:methylmalonyl-CoA carboxyltransferase [Candidatus Atribacteria bacterium CG2_30_33_13]|uniref:Propionyl-CoA carboxylase beta chain n=3 Tax=Candidatus Infernicultor aquiphilus TaxID=1805029 RepID=A0A1J5GYT4_9BACT|nr:MAG: methylmalonyl-CoA carboxyltransferase [Candidatus Atribacteria bacterium CG2_30_33_13]
MEVSINDLMKTLREKEEKAKAGGGEKRIKAQHEKGKLTARERVGFLLDKDSFVEQDLLVEHRCINFDMDKVEAPGEGVVTGYGTIDGRLVYVFAQDFTVMGGSLGEMHAKKICKIMDMAMKMGAPCIGINDSGGARIQEGVDSLSGYGQIFYRNTIASGVIPQISIIVGPAAGGAVYSPAIMDFVFMVKNIGIMHITGPEVIKAVTGEVVSSEQLGGAMTHNVKSGVAHFAAENEAEVYQMVRKLTSFIPSNNVEDPPIVESKDDLNRKEEILLNIVPLDPNKPYEMKEVIKYIVDEGDFFESQSYFATNIITGFARLNGHSIGIIANQPKVLAGCLDINASDKASRFIRFCDAFNIPILTFVDVPGFLPGTAQEYGGIIRHGAKLLYAYSEATVPKITLIIRKSYGGAYLAMCSRDLGADQVIAWPTAEIAVMGSQGAANIIFKKEIMKAENPEKVREEKIEEFKQKFSNPYEAAKRGYVDMVIDPRETRPRLITILEMLSTKRESRPAKKHGNFPV